MHFFLEGSMVTTNDPNGWEFQGNESFTAGTVTSVFNINDADDSFIKPTYLSVSNLVISHDDTGKRTKQTADLNRVIMDGPEGKMDNLDDEYMGQIFDKQFLPNVQLLGGSPWDEQTSFSMAVMFDV